MILHEENEQNLPTVVSDAATLNLWDAADDPEIADILICWQWFDKWSCWLSNVTKIR